MNKVNTVIIPVAGKGTRFLPVTKSVTKTMFPIINKPVLHYLIEEGIKAGIKRFIIVINDEQDMIKDYLDLNSDYYNNLHKEYLELNQLDDIIRQIEINFVHQEKPLGLGHAILCCKELIKNEPFGVMLGDDLVLSDQTKYGISDLIKEYNKNAVNYLGVQEVEIENTKKYGIVKTHNKKVVGIVEKPQSNPPSNLAVVGRYVFNPSIFDYLETLTTDGVKEIQLTDAIELALSKEVVNAIQFSGIRFDIGDHSGYIEAVIYAALLDKTTKQNVLKYIDKYQLVC
ncbi:MAG: UTP--glucose-1-phosphate uridylyltransferase [Bacilli bacterium]|nr:UTP--glucose-1-phosphate uridylyltransferase [Bacilli bacterium]